MLRVKNVVIKADGKSLLFLSRIKRVYLLAAIERLTFLQKTKTESLFNIKNWEYCNKS